MFSTPLNEYRPIDFVLPSPAGLFINEHGTDRQEWGSMRTTGKHSPKMVFARDRWGEPSRLVNPSVARRSSRPSLGPGGRGSHLVLGIVPLSVLLGKVGSHPCVDNVPRPQILGTGDLAVCFDFVGSVHSLHPPTPSGAFPAIGLCSTSADCRIYIYATRSLGSIFRSR